MLPDTPVPPSPGPEACSQGVITVEKFLRSVQTPPRTKQRASGATSLRKPRAYIRRRRITPVRNAVGVPKRPKESSGIAAALYRAAVLTDGNPLDSLADGAGVSLSRRPLKFVPFNKFADSLELDPARTTKPSDVDRGENAVLHIRRCRGHTSDLKAHHHHSSSSHPRTPLFLVPLREAEVAYSSMFP